MNSPSRASRVTTTSGEAHSWWETLRLEIIGGRHRRAISSSIAHMTPLGSSTGGVISPIPPDQGVWTVVSSVLKATNPHFARLEEIAFIVPKPSACPMCPQVGTQNKASPRFISYPPAHPSLWRCAPGYQTHQSPTRPPRRCANLKPTTPITPLFMYVCIKIS
jgi:hypothetical protein